MQLFDGITPFRNWLYILYHRDEERMSQQNVSKSTEIVHTNADIQACLSSFVCVCFDVVVPAVVVAVVAVVVCNCWVPMIIWLFERHKHIHTHTLTRTNIHYMSICRSIESRDCRRNCFGNCEHTSTSHSICNAWCETYGTCKLCGHRTND